MDMAMPLQRSIIFCINKLRRNQSFFVVVMVCCAIISYLISIRSIPLYLETNNQQQQAARDDGVAQTVASVKDVYALSIVYFTGINTNNVEWKDIINEQLSELVSCGLAQEARSISIVLTSKADSLFNDTDEISLYEAELLIKSMPVIGKKAVIFSHSGNQYEYRGIKRFWDESFVPAVPLSSNHFMLYFHAKGMFTSDKYWYYRRSLTSEVIRPWKDVLQRFKTEPGLQKAGLACGLGGWVWYNFIWTRASYVQTLVRPILSTDRYYYEYWMAYGNKSSTSSNITDLWGPQTCLSLCCGNKNKTLNWAMENFDAVTWCRNCD